MSTSSHQHTIGIRRRELLQVGYSGLMGLGLSAVVPRFVAAKPGSSATGSPLPGPAGTKPKSVLIVFLTGACSHHDTFDMKPEAPAEIRGDFKPISTSIAGLHVCEHLPRLASLAHQYAVVRTLSHSDNNHLMSTHHVLTGTKQPGGFFDKVASRDDWPSYSAGLSFLRPRNDGLPSGVNLPTYLMEGPLTWPGQHAGFLGAKYDPWQITGDPAKKDFKVDNLTLAPGIDISRLEKRQSLLAEVDREQRRMEGLAESQRMTNDQQLAFSMLTSSRLSQAFDLKHESDATRDRYGRNTYGQSLLLGRRVIEAGVPVVQVNMGRVQNWDNHGQIFQTLKGRLLPPLDLGVSALLEDMESRGLLENTMVMMLGEFGRTPKINGDKGRDHWGHCFFGLFAGAGVRGGQVIGRSDDIGSHPVTNAYTPNDVGATVYRLLGVPEDSEVHDRLGRPVRLCTGTPIEALFTGTGA